MSIKLGNISINSLGVINKGYLGSGVIFGGGETAFISLWETTTDNETITLPVALPYTWDWGDGTINTETSHEYATAGQYTIKTSDTLTDWNFLAINTSRLNILGISNFSKNFVTLQGQFINCVNLDISAPTNTTINTATIWGSQFKSNSILIGGDWLSNLDTSIVINLSEAFSRCYKMNVPLNWDTSNVESWQNFLYVCTDFNQDVSNLDYSSAKNLSNFMGSKSSANYDATYYDNLLIKWDSQLVFANMVNVNIGMGTIKYTAAGATAHASLLAKGFIVTDGGQI